MLIEMTQFSVVVLAQAHNPSILNPDFLINNKIVDPSLTPSNVLCTPPVASVVFAEGISITAEFEKLQFIDSDMQRIPNDSPIPSIACRYIDALPHVNYTAAGINFSGHYRFADPETVRKFILDKFIKDGPWLNQKDEILSVGINLVYSSGNVKRALNISPGEYKKEVPIVLVRYNHHFQAPTPVVADLRDFILNWKNAFELFSQHCEQVFAEGN
jgi:hypothetical protein